MLYLIGATVSASALFLLLRIGESKGARQFNFLSVNYLLSLILSAASMTDWSFPLTQANATAAGLGFINGALYLISLLVMQVSMRKNGMIPTSTFSRLGVIVPIIMSFFVFREQPTAVQVVGVGVAAVAIFVMQWKPHTEKIDQRYAYLLIVQLLISGFSNVMSKMFSAWGDPALKNHFIVYTFLVALGMSLACKAVKRPGPLQKIDVVLGVGIGLANFASANCTLTALYTMPSYLVYPLQNVGALLIVSLCSLLLWKDRITPRQGVGMGLICAAVVLLNI